MCIRDRKETIVGVSSEGFINLKNAYVWGAFNFAQKNLTDAGYNAVSYTHLDI